MIIDLSTVEVFDSNELEFDKRVTFIFGKSYEACNQTVKAFEG
ncbi:MAG: hypothetical protein Q4D29_12120 [Lachnospiraceae bacterium]|nr:hypothetical protein [Lachnospiraceae bacterium]